MSDGADGDDKGRDPLGDNSPSQIHLESEREWNKMSDQFVNAGYREGITAGKESAVQAGFDEGFASVGAPIGRELGNLRGLAAGAISFIQSAKMPVLQQGSRDELLQEMREISERLARVQLENIAPPDEEALAHARDHAEMNGDPRLPTNTSATRAEALLQLSNLTRRLEKVFKSLKPDLLLPLPGNATEPTRAY